MQSSHSPELSLEDKQELDLWHCARSFVYWLVRYGVIVDEDSGTIHRGLALWPGQAEYVRLMESGANIITGKARQLGASWLATNFDCWEMLFRQNIRLAVIAQNDEYAKKHVKRLRQVYDNQPAHLKRKAVVVGFDNQHTFGIGDVQSLSVCEALVPDEKTARGITARRVRCEELAYWDNAEAVWAALRGSTADAGRQVLVVSTANGEGNWYHNLWGKASAGSISLVPVFFPWHTHPGRGPDFRKQQEAEMGRAFAMQEFPATPEEMFIASGARFLNGTTLQQLADMWARPRIEPLGIADFCSDYNEPSGGRFNNEPSYAYRVFKRPEPGRRYIVATDSSEGGGDACAAYIGDIDSGEQVATLHSYVWGAAEFGKRLNFAGRAYNNALMVNEDNNMGVATIAELVRVWRYPNMYTRPKSAAPEEQDDDAGKMGWTTNRQTRPLLFTGLQEDIPTANSVLHDAETYSQLRALAYVRHGESMKIEAPQGQHDDLCICAGIFGVVRQRVLNGPGLPWVS